MHLSEIIDRSEKSALRRLKTLGAVEVLTLPCSQSDQRDMLFAAIELRET